ncbi:recombinase family protein [Micromonospora sp. NBC_00898]|uniref:recombinase family protein n=1 Tax=Micromonospora sp. NBC_00898 TaxID=2975981 RepID=UPI00386A2446|nr:recombinase family protein [Micromonospora sp. NBC_00898]
MARPKGGGPVRASIYVRISKDLTGEELGVARQEEKCRELCARLGFEVGEVFSDNDVSATKGKVRPGFEALLASQPETVVCWHTDRLVRVTKDLERVIALSVNVHAVRAGHLDLSTPAGRAVARTVTAWATYEGEQKAERQALANLQAAKAGKPYTAGIRPFGYGEDHVAFVPAEAEAIREGASMILAGGSLSSVARKWTEAGLLSPRSIAAGAKAWTLRGVKKVLTSPRYIGQRTYRGEVMGDAEWPAILDDATHYAVVSILSSPDRFSGGPRTGRTATTLLAGIAVCGVCGETVSGRGYRGTKVYGCRQTHTRTPRDIADERAEKATLARMVWPDFLPTVLAMHAEGGDADTAHLQAEMKSLRERLDGLALAYAEGAISLSQMTAGSEALRVKLEEVESKLSGVTGLPPLDPVSGIAGLIEGWAHTRLPVKRSWVAFCTIVTLRPANGKHARNMTPEDHVSLDWHHLAGDGEE